MYGSPIWTLRAGLRARWVKIARRRGLDERAAHAAREAHPLTLDVGAGAAEDLGRLGEVDDLDADLLEEGVGVGLDLLEALGRDDLDRRQLPGQVRQRVQRPGEALALSRGPTAPYGGVFEVRHSHRLSSGSASADGAARYRHGTAARIRGGVPVPCPRRRRGSRGGARRRRRSGGTGCRGGSGPRRGPSRRPGSRR